MNILKSTETGLFLINGVGYPRGSVKRELSNGNILITDLFGHPIFYAKHEDITNGDTNTVFASDQAVFDFIDANFFKLPSSTGGGGGGDAVTGKIFHAPIGFYPTSNQASEGHGANVISVCKFYLPYSLLLNKLSCYISTPGNAGATVQMGVYDDAGNKVAETATSAGTAVGLIAANVLVPVTLEKGFYWAAFVPSDNTILTYGTFNSGSGFFRNTDMLGDATNVVAAGVMPATLGVINSTGNNGQIILLST